MINLQETVVQVVHAEATLLITGDSGTGGKEIILGVIHFNRHRKDGPSIKLNGAAITGSPSESELFGHGQCGVNAKLGSR